MPRTADFPDGIKEPTKWNGEPIANTVPAKEGAFAPGATHAFAKEMSHRGEAVIGVHKTEGAIGCVGCLSEETKVLVPCTFRVEINEAPATAVLCLYSLVEMEEHTEEK